MCYKKYPNRNETKFSFTPLNYQSKNLLLYLYDQKKMNENEAYFINELINKKNIKNSELYDIYKSMLLKYFYNDSLEKFEEYKYKKSNPIFLKDKEENIKYEDEDEFNPNILSSSQCQINIYSNFLIDYELEIQNINKKIEDEDL